MGADASKEQIWRYLGQYVAGADAATYPELDRLIDNAMAYNRDFVAPTLLRRKPVGGEVAALRERGQRRVLIVPQVGLERCVGFLVHEVQHALNLDAPVGEGRSARGAFTAAAGGPATRAAAA